MSRFERQSFHAILDLLETGRYSSRIPIKGKKRRRLSKIGRQWTVNYGFENHFHPYVADLLERLIEGEVPGLQDADTEVRRDADGKPVVQNGRPRLVFEEPLLDSYRPTSHVEEQHPIRDLALGTADAYAVYNWEIFFHIPLTLGIHLSRGGRYDEAQRWFHYIFDPTDDSDGPTPERFWKFRRFRTTDVKLLEEILLNLSTGKDPALRRETLDSIAAWKDEPFRPHVVARYRPSAFMFKTVMAYLDNLIAWGDALFRQDSRETINEATQLYVLAANILGPRPQPVPGKRSVRPRTYADFRGRLDGLSNALASLESDVPHDILTSFLDLTGTVRSQVVTRPGASLYFCVPRNPKLLEYWTTVGDRLFKIRNSLDIRGVFRQLALFDPPIDPALLARAAASGLDIGATLAGLDQPLPLVRFRYLVQKALELSGEVRTLGQSLLASLERQDTEKLTLLRARHETSILKLTESVRYGQLQEAKKNREGIEQSVRNTFERYRYYERLLGRDDGELDQPEWESLDASALERLRLRSKEPIVPLRELEIRIDEDAEGPTGGRQLSPNEARELTLLDSATKQRVAAAGVDRIGSTLSMIPEFGVKFQPFGGGGDIQIGGRALSTMFSLLANQIRTSAEVTSALAARTGRIAGYERREQDWAMQSNAAAGELGLLAKQLRAAEIREAVAAKDLENHRQQMRNAEEIQTFLEEEKTTGLDFAVWMTREVQGLHRQAYELAYDVAKKAERALQHEMGNPSLSYIQFGHLAGKEGLLAGEKLALDVRRMELAHLDMNRREYELTTHLSLRRLDPLELLKLRATGSCTLVVPEEVFDLDCPGHYFRRIRSVSLSLPSIVGPYTGVHARLSLIRSRTRIRPQTDGKGDSYGWEGPEDPRFSDHHGSVQTIVTSTGQNDGGLFEVAGGDERYLPFEGAGAISEWSLDLPAEFRAFDYGTLADAILHLSYTAREGGKPLAEAATAALKDRVASSQVTGQTQLLSVRHDFPAAWAAFRSADTNGNRTAPLKLQLAAEHYPYWSRDRIVGLAKLELVAQTKNPQAPNLEVFEAADMTGEKDSLMGRIGSGDEVLQRGALKTLPPHDGVFERYLTTHAVRDLWIALTWIGK